MLRLPVPPEVDLPLEPLLAEPAGEGFVSRVLPHMRDQVAALTERLAAHHALVGFLP